MILQLMPGKITFLWPFVYLCVWALVPSCIFSPHFFKDIKISALALLKMVMHARSGGTLEVMGLLIGKVDANTMIVMDSFALPVEGTETRVNAQAQAYEYMTAYMEAAKSVCTWFINAYVGDRNNSS